MTMSDGRASDGDGHGAGAAGADGDAAGGAPLAVAEGDAAGVPAPLDGVGDGTAGEGDAAGHGDPGGRQGLSGVGSIPFAHGAPAGPTTRPLTEGTLKVATGIGATADFMNFCQIVAGRVPPETWIPCTLVIAGVCPVFGSVVYPIHTAVDSCGV